MATIPPDKIAEVRDRVDIERLIGRSVTLKRTGNSLMGCCPFHNEKTPSFSVDPVKKLYHCFGCGVGGDVFDFVMRQEGVDFPTAVRQLAGEFGVQLPQREESPSEKRARVERQRMYRVNEIAREHYRAHLAKNERAQAYLREERGLSDDTIRRFRLGFAPDDWDRLATHLSSRNVPVDLPLKLGLVARRNRGDGVYDKVRGKVVFPIVLPGGDIAGFGARRADWLHAPDSEDRGPKYLNSSESAVYDKSRIFYGMDLARDPIRRRRRALLVEGYFDVIALHQAGVPYAVACCGTTLSPRHALQLARLLPEGGEVITLYDGDSAGQAATVKAAEVLLAAGVKVRVLRLAADDDPDTFVRREGGDALEARCDASPSAIDAFLEDAIERFKGAGVSGTVEIVKAIRPMLLAVKSRDEAGLWAEAVAQRLGISAQELRRQLRSRDQGRNQGRNQGGRRNAPPRRSDVPPWMQDGPPPPGDADMPAAPDGDEMYGPEGAQAAPLLDRMPPSYETEILSQLVESPNDVLAKLEAEDAAEAFAHPAILAAVTAARQARDAHEAFDAPRALAVMTSIVTERVLAHIRKTMMTELPVRDPLADCISLMKKKHHKAQLKALRLQGQFDEAAAKIRGDAGTRRVNDHGN